MSGKDTKRPALQEMMNFVREGDSVVVESISRFARNTKDLLELTEQLNSKHTVKPSKAMPTVNRQSFRRQNTSKKK